MGYHSFYYTHEEILYTELEPGGWPRVSPVYAYQFKGLIPLEMKISLKISKCYNFSFVLPLVDHTNEMKINCGDRFSAANGFEFY